MLVRLLYASRPAAPLTATLIDAILTQSQDGNQAKGITGILCFNDELFLQVLEGGRDEVCELFNSIARDNRHENVRLLSYEEILERQFGSWTMGQVSIAKLNPGLVLKYFKRMAIDPFDSSGKATLALLGELVATGAITNRIE